jgi:predicted Zn-dependent peptidase
LTYGKRESVDDICQKIDAVTKEDILRVGARALKSAPTVVSHGNLATLPEYNLIATALR